LRITEHNSWRSLFQKNLLNRTQGHTLEQNLEETYMRRSADEDAWLTAAECANRIGLTARALRLYEQHGLINPRRTEKNWRLYGAGEIARLNEILALKRLGLSLSSITRLLAGHATDLDRLLAMQHSALLELRGRAERSLTIVGTLRAKIVAGEVISTDELLRLAKETNMTDTSSDAIAWRRYEQARPRTELKINPALCADCAGHYQLEEGEGFIVTYRDGHLFTRVTGQVEVEAFPEGDDQFFLKVVPAQITFVRDSQNVVSGLVLHQHGYDHVASRVDEAVTQSIEDALAERIKTKTPLPDSETLLRRIIAEHQRGEPDYEQMRPPLAALAHEQVVMIQADLARMGPLQDVSFKGVGPGGWDVYDVHFEQGHMEWGFVLASDGKFSGIYLRPSL
jgi:DNA-binding transcriptional MerR regulator